MFSSSVELIQPTNCSLLNNIIENFVCNQDALLTIPSENVTGNITDGTINGLTISPSTGILTLANDKTFQVDNSMELLSPSDGGVYTFPATSPDTLVTLTANQTLTNKRLTSPTLTTPNLGAATATTINKVAITQPANSATLTIADGKTITCSNTLTLSAIADGQTFIFPSTSDTIVGATVSQALGGKTYNGLHVTTTNGTFTLSNNKTLSCTNTMTLSAGADGQTFTFPNASDTIAGLAVSQALTNKTYEGLTITNNGGNTLSIASGKQLVVSNSLGFIGTDLTAFTFPSTNDTIVGLAASQTLTNKTLTTPNISGYTYTNKQALSPSTGWMAYDTTFGCMSVYNGKNWSNIKSDVQGFKLTSTWNALGDSYGQTINGVSGWPPLLATATSTTAVNNCVSATTIDYPSGQAGKTIFDAMVDNSAYANYSTVIAYGENDYRSVDALYQNTWWWKQVYANLVFTAAVPWANIIDCHSFGTKFASDGAHPVVNTPIGTSGVGLWTIGDYVEQTGVTGRYYYISVLCVPTKVHYCTITIGGTVQSTQAINIPAGHSGNNFANIGILIDMGSSASRTVRITKDTGSTTTDWMFPTYVSSWDLTSANMRNVLCVTIPRTDQAFNTDSGNHYTNTTAVDLQWMSMNWAIDDIVILAQRCGLPVFMYRYSNGGFNNQADGIHNTTTQQNMEVDHIKRFGMAQ